MVQANAAQPYTGILGNNKADFYRFTLPTAATLKITAHVDEKSPGTVNLELFKNDVSLGGLTFIKYGSPGTLTSDKALDPGDYIIKISGDAIYQFEITTQ